ncbi:PAS domain S-box protein [Patescibacteria group bacterium]|nr:PAS domain S-box protein [Patescibacteria group bacterium]
MPVPLENQTLPKPATELEKIRNEEARQKASIVRFTAITVTIVVACWSLAEWLIYARPVQAITEFLGTIAGIVFLWWQSKTSNQAAVGRVFSIVLTVCLLIVNLTYITQHELSLAASNIFWLFLIPPIVFFNTGQRGGLFAAILVGIWTIVFFVLTELGIVGHPVGAEYILDLLIAFAVVSAFLFLYERVKDKVHTGLATALTKNRAVLDTISDGIIVIDLESKIQVFNHAAERLLEWKDTEVISHNIEKIFTKTNLETILGKVPTKSAVQSGVKIETKNNRIIYADLTVSPLHIKESSEKLKPGIMLTLHDVTGEKELQQMKLDFVAMAAHELRTPTTSIVGHLSVLKDELGPNLDPEHYQFLSRAITSGKQLTTLMENLLSVTKIERDTVALQKAPIGWEEFVRETISKFSAAAQKKGLSIKWITPKYPLPKVMADLLRISEVLSNLLDNAIKYTNAGKIIVWCEIDHNNKMIITHIKDSGCGISKEDQARIFQKFYRIGGSLEMAAEGAGLGLYITKSIINMHDGEIWADSELGLGSTFSFSLPYQP